MAVHVLLRGAGTDRILGQRRADPVGECTRGVSNAAAHDCVNALIKDHRYLRDVY